MIFSDKSLVRLSRYLKVSEPVDPSWEEEYGDVETFDQPEEERQYGGLSEEDFVRGETNMALMGYDISRISEERVVEILVENPDILKLMPKFDIRGRYVHTLRQTRVPELIDAASGVSSLGSELCVTDANAAPFWEFSEYRRFGLVFEGPCKVIWNADMFSVLNGNRWQTSGEVIEYIDKLTEGYIVPSECKLVGLRVKEDEKLYTEVEQIKEVCSELGIEFNNYGKYEKVITGAGVVEYEESQEYSGCPVDVGSPEHLYEETEEGDTYQEKYNNMLLEGVNTNNIELASIALQYGADPDKTSALYYSFYHDHDDIANMLLDNGANPKGVPLILRWTAGRGKDELVEKLIKSGADPNDSMALTEAAASGRESTVNLLLEYGADPNSSKALYYASEGGYTDIVELLLEYKVDPNSQDALYNVSILNLPIMVKTLLEYGADPNSQEALIGAVNRGHVEVVKLLLGYGGDPTKLGNVARMETVNKFITENNLGKYMSKYNARTN